MPSDSVNGGLKKESVRGGLKNESVHGGPKNEFLERFSTRYETWHSPTRNKKDEELPKQEDPRLLTENNKHLCARIRKKREEKTEEEKDEEDRVVTDSSLPVQKIHGFDNEIKSLKHFLLDQKVSKVFKTLVIVGEYGVGKTALCKKIFNDEDVKSVYAPRIWVSMPSKESKEELNGKIRVLKKILKGLGVEDSILETISTDAKQEAKDNQEVSSNQQAGEIDTETEEDKVLSALLYALHLSLRWKKYLIVFDDVREEDDWNEILQDDVEKLKEEKKWGKYLSDGFPKGSGGRVIYTTRNESVRVINTTRNESERVINTTRNESGRVINTTGDEKKTLAKKLQLVAEEHEIHRLWPLTDTVSVWNIYEEALIENGETPPRNDKKCIDELMNKSRGLPLAARLLATLLPVFLDDVKTDQNGSTNGTTAPASNPTPEENITIPPQQT